MFLGRNFSTAERHSEDTSQRIDAEIRRIVTEQYSRAMDILTKHRKELEQIAEALLEYETLDGGDIDTLLRGGVLDRPVASAAKKRASAATEKDEVERKRPAILPPLGKKDPSPEPA